LIINDLRNSFQRFQFCILPLDTAQAKQPI
jgi:hypothetical protein